MWGRCNYCKYYHEENHIHKCGWCNNIRTPKSAVNAEDSCSKFEPMKEDKTMSKTKTEEKLKNLEGMKGAIENIVAQAWERGYKYGLYEAEQKHQVKVMIGGEQVYPEPKVEIEE